LYFWKNHFTFRWSCLAKPCDKTPFVRIETLPTLENLAKSTFYHCQKSFILQNQTRSLSQFVTNSKIILHKSCIFERSRSHGKLFAQNLVKSKKARGRDLEAHRGAEGRTQWRDTTTKKEKILCEVRKSIVGENIEWKSILTSRESRLWENLERERCFMKRCRCGHLMSLQTIYIWSLALVPNIPTFIYCCLSSEI